MYRSMLGKVREGSAAPMFSALDVRGERFDTRSCLGRSSMVIFFYRSHRCATCRGELLDLKSEYPRIKEHAEVIAISTDSPDEARSLAVELGLPYKVISDPGHQIIDMYDVYDREGGSAFITLFIVDKAGVVRYRRLITGLEDVLPAAEIVNKLKAMRSGL
jgi:peroxiredoxin Q/BCP